MHRKCAQRILEIWEKSVSRVFASEEGWLSELAEALWQVPHMVWGGWKSQHRKIVYLPPHIEKPFNSKVIKSFVPEWRSRKCFCVLGFLCYLYMSYEHSMYITHIHIWLCNKLSSLGLGAWLLISNVYCLHVNSALKNFLPPFCKCLRLVFLVFIHEARQMLFMVR